MLASYLVGKHHARRAASQSHLDRIALDPGRGRAAEDHPGTEIIAGWAQDDGRPMAGLFAPSLRVELRPKDVTGFWNATKRHLPDFQTTRRAHVDRVMAVLAVNAGDLGVNVNVRAR